MVVSSQLASNRSRGDSRHGSGGQHWEALVPLWEISPSGWFVYDGQSRLRYANPALTALTCRPLVLGSELFVIEVAPGVESNVARAFADVRRGVRSRCVAIVPSLVHGELRPVHLGLTRVGSSYDDSAVVGSVTPFLDASNESDASAKLDEVERVVGRILAEITDALPNVDVEPHGQVWLDGLSTRQNEVLRHVLAGHDVVTTAGRLHLSVHTVRNHRQAILRQVGVHSQAELIAWWHARSTHPAARAAS